MPLDSNGKGLIYVGTGEVWATAKDIVFKTDGIGSCVAVAAYDPAVKVGALAHVMLPGCPAFTKGDHNPKYARDAIRELLFKMTRLGAVKERIEACLAGGANVLEDDDDAICKAVIDSVSKTLREEGIGVVATALGGVTRRWLSLVVREGAVYCAEGDGSARLLHRWGGA